MVDGRLLNCYLGAGRGCSFKAMLIFSAGLSWLRARALLGDEACFHGDSSLSLYSARVVQGSHFSGSRPQSVGIQTVGR